MKLKTIILAALLSFIFISDASCANKKKPAKHPTQKELNELTLLLTSYSNNSEGVPPLHYAILKKDTKAINLLLKHGADPKSLDCNRWSCLYYAIKSGSIPLIKKFITLGNSVMDLHNKEIPGNTDAFCVALTLNQYEAAKDFIVSGLIPSDSLQKSFIYLVHPARAYQVLPTDQKKYLLKLMVEHGADINAKTCSDYTPLGYLTSADPNNTEMADFLRSLGAK